MTEFLKSLLTYIPAIIISLSAHEFMHAYSAYRLGDPTAKLSGRMTLNPAKHIDPVGALFMLLMFLGMRVIPFGWAKGVPINPNNFKKPKRDFAISAFCGPLTNLTLAFVSLTLCMIVLIMQMRVPIPGFLAPITEYLFEFLFVMVTLNINLAVFNLLPIPPLDGFKVALAFVPNKHYYKILSFERYGFLLLMVLLWTNLLDPWFQISNWIFIGMWGAASSFFQIFF